MQAIKNVFHTVLSHRLSPEISAGCVLAYRSSLGVRYLLLQYPHGHWDFVKGHIEKGETAEQALLRETEEETGIKSENVTIVPGFRKNIVYGYRAKGTEREKRIQKGEGIFIVKRVIFFLVESTQSSVALSHEHIGSAWLPYEEAMARLTFPRAKRILAAAEEFQKAKPLPDGDRGRG